MSEYQRHVQVCESEDISLWISRQPYFYTTSCLWYCVVQDFWMIFFFLGSLGIMKYSILGFKTLSSNYSVFKRSTVKLYGVYASFKQEKQSIKKFWVFFKFEIANFIINLSKNFIINKNTRLNDSNQQVDKKKWFKSTRKLKKKVGKKSDSAALELQVDGEDEREIIFVPFI